MKKYLNVIFICFLSCIENNYQFVETKDEIKITLINRTSINRGVMKLNNEFYLSSNCSLINKKTIPNWITDKNAPDFSFKEYKFYPDLSDIETPYELYKYKNEGYIYIVKFSDTLKFTLRN